MIGISISVPAQADFSEFHYEIRRFPLLGNESSIAAFHITGDHDVFINILCDHIYFTREIIFISPLWGLEDFCQSSLQGTELQYQQEPGWNLCMVCFLIVVLREHRSFCNTGCVPRRPLLIISCLFDHAFLYIHKDVAAPSVLFPWWIGGSQPVIGWAPTGRPASRRHLCIAFG